MNEERPKKINEYYNVSRAAKFLGVSKHTLRRWVDIELLPAVRNPVNGYRLLTQSDLEELLWKLKKDSKQ